MIGHVLSVLQIYFPLMFERSSGSPTLLGHSVVIILDLGVPPPISISHQVFYVFRRQGLINCFHLVFLIRRTLFISSFNLIKVSNNFMDQIPLPYIEFLYLFK